MSDLQQSAKPYLVPMIAGQPVTLSRRAQKIISAWLAMTVMTLEFVISDAQFVAVPQEDRDHLRMTGRTPKGWRIWVGRYRWAKEIERWTHHTMCLAEERYRGLAGVTDYPQNTQATTFCVGNHLVFYAISSSVGPGQRFIRQCGFPQPLASSWNQIGPAAHEFIRWPPERILSPREVFTVANALFRSLHRMMLEQTSGQG